jgi:DMSO/TMAO reductase YedYZ molybdopterin-dependent catalytic subunit
MSDEKTPDNTGPLGKLVSKLVEAKRSWSREGRLLTGEAAAADHQRLPPGQRLVKSWPVLDLGVQPAVAKDRWHLRVDGTVAAPFHWDWPGFEAQPQVAFRSDMHCVTSWSMYDNDWRGVSARHVLELCQPLPETRHVILHAYDGYTTNVPLEFFAAEDVLIATHWNGAPITREHGGPARLLLPRLYLWKSAKWLCRIQFTAEDGPGFWETRGYHNLGDPWEEQRYDWQ